MKFGRSRRFVVLCLAGLLWLTTSNPAEACIMMRSVLPGWGWWTMFAMVALALALCDRWPWIAVPLVILWWNPDFEFGYLLFSFLRLAVPLVLASKLLLDGCSTFTPRRELAAALLGVTWLASLSLLILSYFVPLQYNVPHTGCKNNLANLAHSVEYYQVDHDGAYPASLDELAPAYMDGRRTLPVCDLSRRYRVDRLPSLSRHLFALRGIHFGASYGYRADADGFLIWCQSSGVHLYRKGYPRYWSAEGIISRPPPDEEP